jgi:hypothetical protein
MAAGLLALTTLSTGSCTHAASAPQRTLASDRAQARYSLRALDLQLSDLPAGYTQKLGRYWTNAQRARVDGVSVRTYERQGRLLSYEAQFERDSLVGMTYLDVTVIAYEDAPAAHRAFTDNARSLASGSAARSGLRPISVGRLGSERQGFILSTTQQGFALSGDAVVFRRGRYMVTAIAGGVSGTYSIALLTRLLGRVDGRIMAAGVSS